MTRENLFDERPVSADQNAPAWRRGLDQYVVAPLARFVAAPPWDPTTRGADMLRVFFVGAVFGGGAAAPAGAERRDAQRDARARQVGAAARAAAAAAARAAPRAHGGAPDAAGGAAALPAGPVDLERLDLHRRGALDPLRPAARLGRDLALLLALVGCVAAGVGPSVSSRSGCGRRPGDPHIGGSSWQEPHVEVPRRDSFERTASWTGWDVENVENADDEVAAALPWRAARRGWDAAGVDFAYDLWEGGYPDLAGRGGSCGGPPSCRRRPRRAPPPRWRCSRARAAPVPPPSGGGDSGPTPCSFARRAAARVARLGSS